MDPLKSKPLFSADVLLDLPLDIGNTPHGLRRIVYVKGGSFEGENIKGEILAGGGDWLLVRPDGAWELDVRATLQSDDGQRIYTYYRGIIDAPPEIVDAFRRGERDADPAKYYFRTSPVFETGSDKYAWMNRIICVGVGRLTNTGISYVVHQIL